MIAQSFSIYNFDRSLLDQDEIDMLLAIECRLNRLSGILERIGAGFGPCGILAEP